MSTQTSTMNRRGFLKTSAAATVAGAAAATAAVKMPRVHAEDNFIYRNYQPDKMAYGRLGKTNFMCSRLTFGCGAALMGGRATRLLDRAFEQGVNHFDVGTTTYYKGSEKELAPFLKKHAGEVWVTSKAFPRNGMGTQDDLTYTADMAKQDAVYWTELLEGSLSDLDQDHVDAYYLMGVGNPNCVKSEEMHSAFLAAKQAGKVDHYGISTHKRAAACLEAAIECGWHSQAMIAITPAGWYDWDSKQLLEGTPPMTSLMPIIEKARAADIGLVGMKAARFIAPGTALGKGDEKAFDSTYKPEFLQSGLSPFQRSYAYCLAHGMDTVNSDMQNFAHFEENLVAARDFEKYTSMMA
jgi:aryl-alcohol dehydrogenase-like predicted oxidoreductase